MPKIEIKVKAIIFDMDGVITNTMPDHFRAWKAILKKEKINVSFHNIYSREGQRGIYSVFELFKEYGKAVTAHRAKIILSKKERLFKRIVKKRFVIGSRKFLKQLFHQGFKLALVTGTARHELHKILPAHFHRLFTVIITGTDVKDGKPHPEPFLKALKLLKIKAKDAIVIENAPFGIASAKAAGLQCLALETSLSRDYLREANKVFSSIEDLQGKIQFKKTENGEIINAI